MRFARNRKQPRRGALLLVVLVVVALLSVSNLAYYDWTFTERQAANVSTRWSQSRASAESGIEYVRAYLTLDRETIEQDGGWYDNPQRFEGVLLVNDPSSELRTRFSVLAPQYQRERLAGARHGLEDESGRLNLNTLLIAETRETDAGRNQLLELPGMTSAIADAILDWIDEDDDTRTLGAELSYYASLTTPYAPANAPFSSIEQLLQVKGVTRELLYGPDQNRDHRATATELANTALQDVDNADGALDGGWASMLTLSSAELNLRSDGEPKINVNADDLEQLHSDIELEFGLDVANYVIAYRQGGPENTESNEEQDDGPVEVGGQEITPPNSEVKNATDIVLDFSQPGATRIQSVLELIGGRARVVEQNQVSGETLVESPFSDDPGSFSSYLTDLMDLLTTTDSELIPGRININQAPRAVLRGVPGMPSEAVDAILASRDPSAGSSRPERETAAWLLGEGYVDLEDMLAMEPYVTGRGDVYRVQVVGSFDSGGPFCRLEAVIDATLTEPRIVLRRDLSALGLGHSTAVLDPLVEDEF